MIGFIEIENMEFYSNHGCFKEEKIIGNTFLVTLTLEVDMSKPSLSDNINDAVNYQTVYNIVEKEIMKPSNLMEHVARRIINAVCNEIQEIIKIKIKISKINPPIGGLVEKVSFTLSSVNQRENS